MRRLLLLLTLFSLLAVPAASQAAPAASSADRLLPFAARTVDPVAELAEVTPRGEALVLVQLQQRGLDGVVDQIAEIAPVVQPLAPISLLIWADGPATEAIRDLSGVTFAGVLPADLRIAPSVDAQTMKLRVTTVLGGQRQVREVPGGIALARLLATRADVYSVAQASGPGELRDEKTAQIVATGQANPPAGYDPAAQWGVDGSGVKVAIVDSGVDAAHPELDQAVLGCTDYRPGGVTCDTPVSKANDFVGHGTHVAGIVAGDGSTGKGDGYKYGLGVAPGADLWVQNAIDLAAQRPGMIPLFAESAKQGAVVAQNSWGPAGTPQGYDADTRDTDVVVRDGDPTAAGTQPLGLVFSVMNGSGGTSSQGSPDEAKNIIGVGGTGADRGRRGDDLCTCSAHGPALDGRLLPDIVAPGQGVMSTGLEPRGPLPDADRTAARPCTVHRNLDGVAARVRRVRAVRRALAQGARRRDALPCPREGRADQHGGRPVALRRQGCRRPAADADPEQPAGLGAPGLGRSDAHAGRRRGLARSRRAA